MKKQLTLVLIEKAGKVLLGMKKRGFGTGRWNGFGGKVELGETIIEAANRELQEECGITCEDLSQRGIMEFSFDDDEVILEVHVFHGSVFQGSPKETEEMKPKWHAIDEIPYDQMWTDDIYWVPNFLQGRCQIGAFHFSSISNDGKLKHWQLREVDENHFSC